jgi:vacuolar-type H+-ATPase subunit I/STV1
MAYGFMGGVMAGVGYAIAIRNSVELLSPDGGTVLSAAMLPVVAGMLSGFLYGQFAGLSVAARFPALSYEGLVTSLAFDGPIRVRTSVAGIVIAAMMPTVLTTVLSVTVVSLLPTYFNYLTGGPGPVLGPVVAAAIPAQLFLTILVATIVPSAIFVLCLHHIARALGRHRAFEYAALGSVLALICAYVLAPLTPFTSVSYLLIAAAAYGAIMGALYRRFAGLEPLPLPEAVIANDPDALVGADHPARRQHSVILGN